MIGFTNIPLYFVDEDGANAFIAYSQRDESSAHRLHLHPCGDAAAASTPADAAGAARLSGPQQDPGHAVDELCQPAATTPVTNVDAARKHVTWCQSYPNPD
jgi:hypothetical protein